MLDLQSFGKFLEIKLIKLVSLTETLLLKTFGRDVGEKYSQERPFKDELQLPCCEWEPPSVRL